MNGLYKLIILWKHRINKTYLKCIEDSVAGNLFVGIEWLCEPWIHVYNVETDNIFLKLDHTLNDMPILPFRIYMEQHFGNTVQ